MDKSALASSLDSLEKSWSGLDWWLNFWTVVVVVGVAVELVVLVTEYMHGWRDFRRGSIHSAERPSLIIFGLGFLGAALVAFGVAGEFRIHTKAGRIETDMRDKTRQLVALVEKEAAQANEGAAVAQATAKGFESQIAEANARALEAERDLATLEMDRTFDDSQQKQFAKKLKPFAGQEFDLTTYWASKEPRKLAEGILKALKLADWKYLQNGWAIIGVESGVLVYITPATDERTRMAANSLVSALNTEGIASELKAASSGGTSKIQIAIEVGMKPRVLPLRRGLSRRAPE
jgi:hypothetical protein